MNNNYLIISSLFKPGFFSDGFLTLEKQYRMGCVASKLDINDVHPNMFAVNNVDDVRIKLSSFHSFLKMSNPHQSSRWG